MPREHRFILDNIRLILEYKGRRLADLARALDRDQSAVTKTLKGNPQISSLIQAAFAIGVEVQYLLMQPGTLLTYLEGGLIRFRADAPLNFSGNSLRPRIAKHLDQHEVRTDAIAAEIRERDRLLDKHRQVVSETPKPPEEAAPVQWARRSDYQPSEPVHDDGVGPGAGIPFSDPDADVPVTALGTPAHLPKGWQMVNPEGPSYEKYVTAGWQWAHLVEHGVVTQRRSQHSA